MVVCSCLWLFLAVFCNFLISKKKKKNIFLTPFPLVHLEQCNKVTESETNGCVFTIEVRRREKEEEYFIFVTELDTSST